MATFYPAKARIGTPRRVGDGTRVPIFTGGPELPVEIIHGLGRIPEDIWIADKDKWCDFCRVEKTSYRVVLTFSEANVNLIMGFA